MQKNRKNTKTEFFLSYLFKCNIEISLEQFFIYIFSMWKSCMFVCIYSYIFLTVKLPCSEPNTNIKQKKKNGSSNWAARYYDIPLLYKIWEIKFRTFIGGIISVNKAWLWHFIFIFCIIADGIGRKIHFRAPLWKYEYIYFWTHFCVKSSLS